MTNVQELKNLLYSYEQGNGPAKTILLERLFLDNHELAKLLDVSEAAQALTDWGIGSYLLEEIPHTADLLAGLRFMLARLEGGI